MIQTPKSTYSIRSDAIIYIEAADKYSVLHTVNRNIVIHKSISYLASVFPDFSVVFIEVILLTATMFLKWKSIMLR